MASVDKNMEKLDLFCIVGGNVKCYSHCGKVWMLAQKVKHRIIT